MAIFDTPSDKDYDLLLAEIGFITDIQMTIETAMNRKGVSQANLAKLMEISAARVSQILSDNGTNLEARTIARIAHALGMVTSFKFVGREEVKAEDQPFKQPEWRNACHEWEDARHSPDTHVAVNNDLCAEAA